MTIENPQSDLPQNPEPVPSAEQGAAPAAPKARKSLLRFLFNPETRLGKNMRSITRAFGFAVAFFAMGAVLLYVLLYMPVVKQLALSTVQLKTTQLQLDQSQTDLGTFQTQTKQLQQQLTTAKADLARAQARAQVLEVQTQVLVARTALTNKEGAAAQTALVAAQAALEQALPVIQSLDASAAAQLSDRLKLVINGLNDPATAQTDLQLLDKKLTELAAALK